MFDKWKNEGFGVKDSTSCVQWRYFWLIAVVLAELFGTFILVFWFCFAIDREISRGIRAGRFFRHRLRSVFGRRRWRALLRSPPLRRGGEKTASSDPPSNLQAIAKKSKYQTAISAKKRYHRYNRWRLKVIEIRFFEIPSKILIAT